MCLHVSSSKITNLFGFLGDSVRRMNTLVCVCVCVCLCVVQLKKHSRMYHDEFHTALQRIYEAGFGLMFSDITC